MRRLVLAALAVALVAAAPLPAAARNVAFPWKHVRPLSAQARELALEALSLSETIARQFAVLEASDVVVYLTHTMPAHGECFRGHLRFVAAAGRMRFVAVWVDSMMSPDARVALLAHELHHALEVAGAAEVRDEASMVVFYRRTGRPSRGDCFETAGAARVERDVLRELTQPGARVLARVGLVPPR